MTYDLQDRYYFECEQTESSQSTCQNSNAVTCSLQQELKSGIFEKRNSFCVTMHIMIQYLEYLT